MRLAIRGMQMKLKLAARMLVRLALLYLMLFVPPAYADMPCATNDSTSILSQAKDLCQVQCAVQAQKTGTGILQSQNYCKNTEQIVNATFAQKSVQFWVGCAAGAGSAAVDVAYGALGLERAEEFNKQCNADPNCRLALARKLERYRGYQKDASGNPVLDPKTHEPVYQMSDGDVTKAVAGQDLGNLQRTSEHNETATVHGCQVQIGEITKELGDKLAAAEANDDDAAKLKLLQERYTRLQTYDPDCPKLLKLPMPKGLTAAPDLKKAAAGALGATRKIGQDMNASVTKFLNDRNVALQCYDSETSSKLQCYAATYVGLQVLGIVGGEAILGKIAALTGKAAKAMSVVEKGEEAASAASKAGVLPDVKKADVAAAPAAPAPAVAEAPKAPPAPSQGGLAEGGGQGAASPGGTFAPNSAPAARVADAPSAPSAEPAKPDVIRAAKPPEVAVSAEPAVAGPGARATTPKEAAGAGPEVKAAQGVDAAAAAPPQAKLSDRLKASKDAAEKRKLAKVKAAEPTKVVEGEVAAGPGAKGAKPEDADPAAGPSLADKSTANLKQRAEIAKRFKEARQRALLEEAKPTVEAESEVASGPTGSRAASPHEAAAAPPGAKAAAPQDAAAPGPAKPAAVAEVVAPRAKLEVHAEPAAVGPASSPGSPGTKIYVPKDVEAKPVGAATQARDAAPGPAAEAHAATEPRAQGPSPQAPVIAPHEESPAPRVAAGTQGEARQSGTTGPGAAIAGAERETPSGVVPAVVAAGAVKEDDVGIPERMTPLTGTLPKSGKREVSSTSLRDINKKELAELRKQGTTVRAVKGLSYVANQMRLHPNQKFVYSVADQKSKSHYLGSLYAVQKLPKVNQRENAGGLFLSHPGAAKYLAALRARGAKLYVDTSLPVSGMRSYVRPHGYIGIRPDLTWQEFQAIYRYSQRYL